MNLEIIEALAKELRRLDPNNPILKKYLSMNSYLEAQRLLKLTLVVPQKKSSLYDKKILSSIFDVKNNVYDVPWAKKYIYIFDVCNNIGSLVKRELPARIKNDVKHGLCKILFYEPWEAYTSRTPGQKSYENSIKQFANRHGFDISSVGYCDSNFYFPNWPSSIPRFSVMFFEEMIGSKLDTVKLDFFQRQCDKMQNKKLSCEYRYISLNRRRDGHRDAITNELLNRHTDVSLVSYTSQGLYIDIDETVNDLDIAPITYDAYLNVTNETSFTSDEMFITEKTFKPISIGQPFIITGCAGTLSKLRELGYYTYSGLINEEYDTMEDPGDRMDAIIEELRRLTAMSNAEFQDLMSKCYPIGMKNVMNLYSRTQKHETYQDLKFSLQKWLEE